MQKAKILVPVSLNNQSDSALQYGMKLAGLMNGIVTCLHIVEKPEVFLDQFLSRKQAEQFRKPAVNRLAGKVGEIFSERKEVAYELVVSNGKVHRKIREIAKDLDTSLIIMEKADTSDVKDQQVGSNTFRIITKASVPVLSVSNTDHIASDRILLPLDLVNPTELKIRKALDFCKLFNMNIHVFTVLRPDMLNLKLRYLEQLQKIQQIFHDTDIECSVQMEITHSPASQEILKHAKDIHAGMIMIMTQKEIRSMNLVMGSVAEKILLGSKIPVLTINPFSSLQKESPDIYRNKMIDPLIIHPY